LIVAAAFWLAAAVAVYVGTTVSVRPITCVSVSKAGADVGRWQSDWNRAGDLMHAGLGLGVVALGVFGIGTIMSERKARLAGLAVLSLIGVGVLALLVARVLHQAPCEGL